REPLMRRRSGCVMKAPRECPLRHVGASREIANRDWRVKPPHRPLHDERQSRPRIFANGRSNVLRLSAIAMRWNDQASCDVIGDLGPEILADDVEAEVNAGGAAG